MDKPKLVEIAPGIHFSAATKSVLEVVRSQVEPDALASYGDSSKEWAIWGADNDYPQKVVDKVSQDPTSMGAMDFKIRAHYGGGPVLYKIEIRKEKEVIIPQKLTDYPEIADFFFDNDIENFLQGIITDFEWWNRYHVEYITNGAKNKILGVYWKRCIRTRKKKRNESTGRMEGFYLSGDWPTPKDGRYVFIPAFDRKQPFARNKSIYEHKLLSVDKDYYILPAWHSKMAWLEVAHKIPKWINANIENAVNLKYHIEIPEQYFEDLYPEHHYGTLPECLEARKKAEEDLKDEIIAALTGVENVAKTFFTKFATDENGNVLPGWKINILDNPVQDDAWLKADQVAAGKIVTADGVPASLANVIISNTEKGSGSDIREQFNFYNSLKTVIPQQTTTEWFEFVKRFNKWDPELHLGFRKIFIDTINNNKSGVSKEFESEPTTTNKN